MEMFMTGSGSMFLQDISRIHVFTGHIQDQNKMDSKHYYLIVNTIFLNQFFKFFLFNISW